MPTVEILIAAKAQNLAEFEAVQARLAGMDAQVKTLDASLNQSTGTLKIHGVAQAESAAEAQKLATKFEGAGVSVTGLRTKAGEAAVVERDLARDSNAAARAMGHLGAAGAESVDRLSALAGVAGSGGPLGLALGAAVVAAGALVEGTKAVDEAYQKQQRSTLNLKQAADATHQSYEGLTRQFETFAAKNKQFIPDENAARDVLAGFVRAGFNAKDSMKDLGIALDLAALKNEDLNTAGQQVLLMLMGNSRVAKSLGIDLTALKNSTDNQATALKNLTKANDEVAKAQAGVAQAQHALKLEEDALGTTHKLTAHQADVLADRHNAVKTATDNLTKAQQGQKTAQDNANTAVNQAVLIQGQLSVKTEQGRKAVSDQQQATNRLNAEWEKFAHDVGPAVSAGISHITLALSYLVSGLDRVINAAQGAEAALNRTLSAKNALGGLTGGGALRIAAPIFGKQAGGPVTAGEAYWVGERGPELFVPSQSGGIIPNGQAGGQALGNQVMIYIYGATDPQAVAAAVDQRLSRVLTAS